MDEEYIRIFNQYKNDIYRLAFSYTKNHLDADDISIKKWLTKVTINECKTLFLSAWKRKTVPLTEQETNISKDNKQEISLIDSLFQLPTKYRIVLFLYYYEDYKIKEIAEILSMNEATIKTRLSRARSLLKTILEGGSEHE